MKKLSLILMLALACFSQAIAQDNSEPIAVEGGYVKGVAADAAGITVWKGIPFAAPPVGELRWKAPQPVKPWLGIRICDKFAARPMQRMAIKKPAYQTWDQPDNYASEDCLYLNVWAPTQKPEKPMPVMVWIFGGGFHLGSTDAAIYRGEPFVKNGVIFVSVPYRLGVFGYFAHPELSKESGHGSGNYASYDQLAGIKWVKENIAKFGGDPNNITVFGQSAGSRSTQVLMSSKLSKGMFQRAIPMSGCAIREDAHCLPLADNEKLGVEFMKAIGCKSLKDLRALSEVELQEAYSKSKFWGKFRPAIDGYFLTEDTNDAALNGNYLNIDYMIGYTKDDVPAANFPKSIGAWVENHLKHGFKAPYVYRFDHALPGGDMNGLAKDVFGTTGAIHSCELGYVFNQVATMNRPVTPADYELAERSIKYWTNFAKYGNPNGATGNDWPPYTQANKNTFIIDVK